MANKTSPAVVAGIYFLVAFLVCVGVLVAVALIKIDKTRSSFFAPPPEISSKEENRQEKVEQEAKKIDDEEKQENTGDLATSSVSKTEPEQTPRALSVQEIVSKYRHPMVPKPPQDVDGGGMNDGFDNEGRASTLTIENTNIHEELAPRHSTAEEVENRLSMEGHLVFIPKQEFMSGAIPCNPTKRLDRMFRHAIRVHNTEQFDLALSSGADLSVRTAMAYTLLHESIVADPYMTFMTKLLSFNADGVALLNAASSHGTTPLMKAVEFKQVALVQKLYELGADINAQDALGRTALMIGAMTNTSWAAKVLVPRGADPDLVDVDGRRAVDLALLYGNARVASDLNGSALAVVPGYIAPRVQNNYDGLNLIYIIAWHGVDVATDVLLAISLARSGHPVLCFFTSFFLFLPSVFIFCIPYQSIIERVLTLLQLRIIYEGLISMGQERLTVRFGATQMYHTVLQNVPQAVMQTYMLALLYQGNDSLHSNSTTLFLAIMSTVYQSTTTFHNMYVMRFFVTNNDSATQKLYVKMPLILGLMMGVIVRLTMWGTTLIVYPQACVLLFVWVFLTRFRLIGVGKECGNKDDRSQLEATVVDLFATFLCDVPFITNSQCFLTSLMLSSAEVLVFLGPCLPSWHNYPAINAMISLMWLWFVFSVGLLAYLHGDQLRFPDEPFLTDFCMWSKFLAQLTTLYTDAKLALTVSFTVLRKEVQTYLEGRLQRRAEKSKSEASKVEAQVEGEVEAEAGAEDGDGASSVSQQESGSGDGGNTAVIEETQSPMSMPLPSPTSAATPSIPSPSPSLTNSTAGKKKRKKGGPVAPPLLKEKILTMQLPELKYEALEWREKCSFALVFCIVLFGFLSLVGAMASCGLVGNDDDYRVDDSTNANSYHCAGGVSSSYGYFAVAVAPWLMFVFGLAYIVEAATCQVAQQLRNVCSEERGYDAYLIARGKGPSFFWFSESYHMETRTYTVTVSNGRGGTRTETRTEQVKVVTHTASMWYNSDYWLDTSDDFPTDIFLARIETTNVVDFDAYTQNDYDSRFATFKRENDRDVHQNCTRTFKVGGSTENALPVMLIYSSKLPYFLRYTYYLCAVLLLMAPWYRWYVTNMSARRTVNIKKSVRVYPPGADTALLLRWGAADEY